MAAVSRVCQDDNINVNDMIEVSPINTKDLLANIKNRYDIDQIFTNVGETLIIVNPYYIIPGLYTEEKMQEIINHSDAYSNERYERGIPHCFDTTMNTIFDLLHTAKNQALVISGESGAGKTECAKLCMKFIVYYFSKRMKNVINETDTKQEQSLEDKILACNPVLEAFGNAKTVRNDNSSRFGKYIKIFINVKSEKIIGAYMETYLLEKSRVVTLAPGERNYHIFYQIIFGLNFIIKNNFDFSKIFEEIKGMKLELLENTKNYIRANLTEEKIKYYFNMRTIEEIEIGQFNYLRNDVYTVPTINDIFNFFECIQGLIGSGFTELEINYVIQIIMAILWCGNINFENDGEDKCRVVGDSLAIQSLVSKMLNIDEEIFSDVFLVNFRIIKGETIKSPMEEKDCIAFRDTFAKEIYNRLFTFLVKRMNLTLYDENIKEEIETNSDVKHIGLLDIFGFECFKENSFEQFCINYANEKLQNLYVEDIFKEIEYMFIREGLKDKFEKIEYKDNILILDAMGKYPSGIFFQLDNECNVGQKDMNLLSRILSTLKSNPAVKNSMKNPDKFFILHTAKNVEYTITGFCVKNLDEFKLRMKDCMLTIKDKQILEMVGEGSGEERHKKEKFLGGKFRTDMDNLAKALRQCVRHYIRCLKPNELKKKKYFVPWFSLLQIKYMGVLDTIRIRQEGFAVIKTYLEFYLMFEDAVDFPGKLNYKEVKSDNQNLPKWVNTITKALVPDFTDDEILFGKTLVLMRQVMCDKLNAARKLALIEKEKMVTILASKIRGMNGYMRFKSFYNSIFTLQNNYKLYEFINRINKVRLITTNVQKKFRIMQTKKQAELYKKKLEDLRTFFQGVIMARNLKDSYIKALQIKYSFTAYINNLKQKKYLRYRAELKLLIEERIANHIKNVIEPTVIFLQSHIRNYLSKIRMGEFYDIIRGKRKNLKQEIACKKLQKSYRRFVQEKRIKLLRKARDKFIGLIQSYRFRKWYVKTRAACIKIQQAFMRKYLKEHIIEERLKEFTEEEDNNFEMANFVSNATLFPGSKEVEKTAKNITDILSNKSNPKYAEIGPSIIQLYNQTTGKDISLKDVDSLNDLIKKEPSLQALFNHDDYSKIKEVKEENLMRRNKGKGLTKKSSKLKSTPNYYEKRIMDLSPIEVPEAQYLNHSTYDDPKLHFFAHILDFDQMVNIDDIYSGTPWSQTFADVIMHNINQDTPVQIIEIGDFHTTLVNTLGKTFTWGWNGNGQCAFNLGKDSNFLLENIKARTKEETETSNIMTKDISEMPMSMEDGIDENFDFDEAVNNIKNEKEIFENYDTDDEETFKKSSFADFYYVNSPMIIDNFTVQKIACGPDNTMVLTNDNKLYVFGANYDYQLGVLKSRNIFSPMQLNNIIKSQQINPLVNLKSKITEMKFSGKNALLLNDSGNLIMLSCFNYVNYDDEEDEENPEIFKTPIELPLPDVKFSHIECGQDFCLLLGENGHLYSMGSNKFGQLGLGDPEPRFHPEIVKFFLEEKIKVQQISCGFKHSCCRANNRAYTWGCNNNGQLATGNINCEYKPVLIDIKYKKIDNIIIQVSCGFRSTVFLTDTRKIFWAGTCGDIKNQKYPYEFDYKEKVPEIFGYDYHEVMKIKHTWSRTMSIFYAIVAETGPLSCKLNNPTKMNFILNKISSQWVGDNIYPPVIEQMEKFVAEKHINRSNKIKSGK